MRGGEESPPAAGQVRNSWEAVSSRSKRSQQDIPTIPSKVPRLKRLLPESWRTAVLRQLGTRHSHLGRRDLKREKFSVVLTYGQACGLFSLLVIDVEGGLTVGDSTPGKAVALDSIS